jgi:transcriptional regulator with XRE-family HTH domain
MPTRLPDSPLYPLIGERVARARDVAGLSQVELARAVGVARTSITNLEGGRQRVTLDHLFKIAQALGVELRDLIPSNTEVQKVDDAVPKHVETIVTPGALRFMREVSVARKP